MTINKSQGQSVRSVGVNLRQPVFTHGQLYVALSRCTSSANVKVVVRDVDKETHKTPNVVYPEAIV
ncbi:helicase [Schizophyllum commune H4-8]|uniref:helicase n=1 Tax=Schizophyllum commune (strain H4-8 / FGSC 9210) TaxID=578458 RepID=UPI00215F7785|nr:helicase [Schizophyllum commune H4-8]XP_050201388.1 helicase [Schizophyllum commune H4-8]KAI5885694.1 helicase [Schizophyllum commune H4-8]KAI5895848.1 helicase [Schizophyllum commune H4-8]